MDITSKTKKQFTSHIELDLSTTELQELLSIRPQLQTEGILKPSMQTLMDAFQAALTDITNKGG